MMQGQVYNRPLTAHGHLIETVLLFLEGPATRRDLLLAVGWAHRYDADTRRRRVTKELEQKAKYQGALYTQRMLSDRRRRLGY